MRTETTKTTDAIRRGDDRGTTDLGWLRSRHSFSFGGYQDPERMGFRALRVLNDDVVAPGRGFGEHGHADMEIISWVLRGALEHRDSTGTSGVLRPGDLQVMSAGRGIRHSEMNGSATDPTHFLQIWIEPAEAGLEPSYAERSFPPAGRRGRWQVVASADGADGSLRINQDVSLSITDLTADARISAEVPPARFGYLHVATGAVRVGDAALAAGDAVTVDGAARLEIEAVAPSQLLLFDLA